MNGQLYLMKKINDNGVVDLFSSIFIERINKNIVENIEKNGN